MKKTNFQRTLLHQIFYHKKKLQTRVVPSLRAIMAAKMKIVPSLPAATKIQKMKIVPSLPAATKIQKMKIVPSL